MKKSILLQKLNERKNVVRRRNKCGWVNPESQCDCQKTACLHLWHNYGTEVNRSARKSIIIVKRSLYRNEHINPISYGLVPTRNPTTALYFVSYPLSSILRSLQEVSSNPPLDYLKITSHFTPQPPPSFQTSPPKS